MNTAAIFAEFGRRFRNILISIDQTMFCLLTLGASDPDETASAAAWRGELNGKILPRFFRPAIDAVWLALFGTRDHCLKSHLNEITRRRFDE